MKEVILLVPSGIKKYVIKDIREKYYNYNIKFMPLDEFIKKYIFDYDNKTIYYLMKKYNIKYSTALIYLDNLYYISDKLNIDKMNKLKEIKEYLDSNNLLIYDNYFKEYIKDKKIYLYGYNYITKYQEKILSNFNYEIIKDDKKKYDITNSYYSNYIDDEVLYVGSKICELLKNGISINNIKIITFSEYHNIIKTIFSMMNIPISLNNNSIYSIPIVKEVLKDINNIENIKDIDLKNKVISIINRYSFIENKKEVLDLIIKDLKNTFIENNSGIKIISINDYIEDNDYVFLMGFNKENIPKLYKDNDYFTDKEKEVLEIDTSTNLNKYLKEDIIDKLSSIKNLTITYKLHTSDNEYIKSNIINTNDILIDNNNYSNSNMINRMLLAGKLDDLSKYNKIDKDLDLLYNNYNDIKYLEYDNSYKNIDKDKLYEYLDKGLLLSYTSFDNYNRCKFKYYLNNILKISIIKDDFAILIGNIVHYILSNMDNDDFDIDMYYNKYIEEQREFTKREKFFLKGIKEELIFIIDTIKKQLTYSTFDKKLYEKKVVINKDKNIKVSFIGVIDKILYKEIEDSIYLVVIDYKTGNTSIKIDNMNYGLDMQLPIYLYLSKNLNKENVDVVGFYLQKFLRTNLDSKKDYDTAREELLKLEGYSVSNESYLSMFDKTYEDSKMIKSLKKGKNGFYSYSKVLAEEEMDEIVTKTEEKREEVINNILEGDFTINPKVIDSDNVSCKFCEYNDICFMREKDKIYINTKEVEEDE